MATLLLTSLGPTGAAATKESARDRCTRQGAKAAEASRQDVGWLGVLLTQEDGRVVVEVVYGGSPALQAGIEPGDVIESIDGVVLRGTQDLSRRLTCHKPGEQVRLAIRRQDRRIVLSPRLAARPDRPAPKLLTRSDNSRRPFLGVTLMDLTPVLGERLGASQGVVITEVYPDSPAARAGLRRGDLLITVDGHPVTSALDVGRCLQQRHPGDTIVLGVHRDEARFEGTVELGRRPDEWVYFVEWLDRARPDQPVVYVKEPDKLELPRTNARQALDRLRRQLLVIEGRLESAGRAKQRLVLEELEGLAERLDDLADTLTEEGPR